LTREKSVLNTKVGDGTAPWLLFVNLADANQSEALNEMLNNSGLPCRAELQIGMSWIFCPDEAAVCEVVRFVRTVPHIQRVRGPNYVPTVYDNYHRDVSKRFAKVV